jgi:pimeloyl-ACP methyl ester carboxylesterase
LEITHKFLTTNGIKMHVAMAGEGPLVLLCHGFPESWYAWRHQLKALAGVGYCAVAPDMRGYGQTDKPEAIDQYTMLHLTGDMVGLVEALGFRDAVVVGHDWGAPVAWHSALFRPDKFKGVVGLSVPFRPHLDVAPTTLMPQTDDAIFYQLYFQEPGVAEAEFERDPKHTIRTALLGLSENSISVKGAVGMVPKNGGWLDAIAPLVGTPPLRLTKTISTSIRMSTSEPGSGVA